MPPALHTVLQEAAARLADSSTPRADAEILLGHVLRVPRSYFYTWPEKPLEPRAYAAYQALIARRAAGEPVAYLTGIREFWSLELAVSPSTLIPRPETEVLVETALAHLPPGERLVLDLGTGAGAVALAIARERPECRIIALDNSPAALSLARRNALRLWLDNVSFLASDWFAGLRPCRADLVVSNPPYIAPDDPHLTQGDLRFEPRQALAAEQQGLAALEQIIRSAPAYLAQGGWLWLEHGYRQAGEVKGLLARYGYAQIETWPDYSGQPRVSGACRA